METPQFTDKASYRDQSVNGKPEGVWWSVGASWMEWCEAEDFCVGGPVAEVTIDLAKVLQVTSVAELDAFHDEFHAPYPGAAYMGDRHYIDWAQVAAKWDGIEIAPYMWARRLDGAAHTWYYGWDCASGVTWRPSRVVQRVTDVGLWTEAGGIAGLLGDSAQVGALFTDAADTANSVGV